MDEKRLGFRKKTLKGGTISHGIVGGIECVIRNLSSAGACLEVEDAIVLPDKFGLVIKPECTRRQCWSRGAPLTRSVFASNKFLPSWHAKRWDRLAMNDALRP